MGGDEWIVVDGSHKQATRDHTHIYYLRALVRCFAAFMLGVWCVDDGLLSGVTLFCLPLTREGRYDDRLPGVGSRPACCVLLKSPWLLQCLALKTLDVFCKDHGSERYLHVNTHGGSIPMMNGFAEHFRLVSPPLQSKKAEISRAGFFLDRRTCLCQICVKCFLRLQKGDVDSDAGGEDDDFGDEVRSDDEEEVGNDDANEGGGTLHQVSCIVGGLIVATHRR